MYKLQHVARELVANAAMGVPAIRRVRIQRGRTVGASIEQKAQAISEQFQFFLAIIGKERLRNAHIVEIGPGDVIPLAPLFIGSGARKYTAIDRFLGAVTSQEAVDLYNQVLQHATPDITETLETL